MIQEQQQSQWSDVKPPYMHTLHLHSHTFHLLTHTHTCTHHTYMHVHMLTHKHSDMHCMSVPIATCIEWLCEMLKCTCVCEGGRGQNRATHSSRWEGNSSPPLTNLQFISPLPPPKACLVVGVGTRYVVYTQQDRMKLYFGERRRLCR